MFLLLLLFQLVVDIFLLICNTCFHLCSISYKNNLLGLKFDFTLSYTFWWKEILVLMGHVYFSIMIYAFVSLRKSSIECPEDCCSVTQSCPALCDPMDYSMTGFSVLHYLLEFAQTHVHWVSDAISLSHPLLSPSPAFNLSPASGSFPMSQLFTSGGQSIGALASVLPSILKIVIYIYIFLFHLYFLN